MKKKPTKTFTVDRSRWRCGVNTFTASGVGTTALLNREGFMCCLGFCSQQCGVAKRTLLDKSYPSWIEPDYRVRPLIELQDRAATINDSPLPRKERESALRSLFRQHGMSITFVGRYPRKAKR